MQVEVGLEALTIWEEGKTFSTKLYSNIIAHALVIKRWFEQFLIQSQTTQIIPILQTKVHAPN